MGTGVIDNVVRPGSMLMAACGIAAIALCVPTHAIAQVPHEPEDGAKTVKHVMVRVTGSPEGQGAAVRSFAWTEADATVAQAPYSAEAVTEVTQTLADGNRINRRTVSKIYRDSAGRVRREQAIAGVGPIGAATDGTRIVFIHDPVGKTMYTLDSARQEARKLPVDLNVVMARSPEPGADVLVDRRVERKFVIAKDGGEQVHVTDTGGDAAMKHVEVFTEGVDPLAMPHGQGEPLGKRTIEGVEAEGTRWAKVIAAGAVGNERPIEVVTERWFSAELKTVVLAKHSDPRVGETVFQLSNIVRAEPPADLFVVPADYKIVEGPGMAISHKVVKE